MKTRAELDAALDALERRLPNIIAECPDDGDFWCEFACVADDIWDCAGAADYEHVRGRIDAMLASNGLIPAEEVD